jgi:hypothetical protein
MNTKRSIIILTAVGGAPLIGLVTYRFVVREPDSHGLVESGFPVRQRLANPPAAPTQPFFPLSMEEKEGALSSAGGDNPLFPFPDRLSSVFSALGEKANS